MTGETVKTLNQFERARKLADCIMYELGSNRAEVMKAIKDRPETDHWLQIAIVSGISTPSETTQQLTLALLEDREALVKRAQDLLKDFHETYPLIDRHKKQVKAEAYAKTLSLVKPAKKGVKCPKKSKR